MATVKNMDVAGLADRLSEYGHQLRISQSAGQHRIIPGDKIRCASYLDRVDAYIESVVNTDQELDLPLTHPQGTPYNDFDAVEDVNKIENADIRDIVRRLRSAWIESTGSQSADQTTGMHTADVERVKALMVSARNMLTLAGEVVIDMPEPTAREPVDEG